MLLRIFFRHFPWQSAGGKARFPKGIHTQLPSVLQSFIRKNINIVIKFAINGFFPIHVFPSGNIFFVRLFIFDSPLFRKPEDITRISPPAGILRGMSRGVHARVRLPCRRRIVPLPGKINAEKNLLPPDSMDNFKKLFHPGQAVSAAQGRKPYRLSQMPWLYE